MRIQPDEGISLRFGAKIPGTVMRQDAVKMDFCYKDYFGASASTGYERLLHDCMIGDQTLFRRADMVEAAWQILAPVLDAQAASAPAEYAAGTWGPREADALMQRDGRAWNNGDA
jgi:glucose-6-phosphate 1-dehydrogenase